ncbi:MFS transporter [Pedobacter polaris]|uniref:MFS transporter n=1 Tax=Pedobacter polaris TaxID=2571273 RepID=A0A4U1CZV2_9SPHI|nr:MFS transporter [Pedobacter polaris]TKC13178.1 MFS transporter [Pedobacter polaris]
MNRILPTIVISQFFCTSLWFAGNAVMADIALRFNLSNSYLAYLTSAVLLGFITGTLAFAVLAISDRFSPSKIFFSCAIISAVINLGITLNEISSVELMLFRFLTGFLLAGIYPIGMKIAADHYQKGLGKSLGFLVGALVIGTAFPHFLKSMLATLPWKYVIYSTSLLSTIGGFAMLFLVPDGPFRKTSQKLKLNSFMQSFKNEKFKSAAFGYFGHMWELYSFWVFVPVILTTYNNRHLNTNLDVSLLSFVIIVVGSLACLFSGLIAERFGAKKIATISLAISGLCCIISPLILVSSSSVVLLTFLLIWSMAVIADSPLFSTLVAQNAPDATKGTSLTIVNCIGFALTIISIQFIDALRNKIDAQYIYMFLAIGPAFGLGALLKKSKVSKS